MKLKKILPIIFTTMFLASCKSFVDNPLSTQSFSNRKISNIKYKAPSIKTDSSISPTFETSTSGNMSFKLNKITKDGKEYTPHLYQKDNDGFYNLGTNLSETLIPANTTYDNIVYVHYPHSENRVRELFDNNTLYVQSFDMGTNKEYNHYARNDYKIYEFKVISNQYFERINISKYYNTDGYTETFVQGGGTTYYPSYNDAKNDFKNYVIGQLKDKYYDKIEFSYSPNDYIGIRWDIDVCENYNKFLYDSYGTPNQVKTITSKTDLYISDTYKDYLTYPYSYQSNVYPTYETALMGTYLHTFTNGRFIHAELENMDKGIYHNIKDNNDKFRLLDRFYSENYTQLTNDYAPKFHKENGDVDYEKGIINVFVMDIYCENKEVETIGILPNFFKLNYFNSIPVDLRIGANDTTSTLQKAFNNDFKLIGDGYYGNTKTHHIIEDIKENKKEIVKGITADTITNKIDVFTLLKELYNGEGIVLAGNNKNNKDVIYPRLPFPATYEDIFNRQPNMKISGSVMEAQGLTSYNEYQKIMCDELNYDYNNEEVRNSLQTYDTTFEYVKKLSFTKSAEIETFNLYYNNISNSFENISAVGGTNTYTKDGIYVVSSNALTNARDKIDNRYFVLNSEGFNSRNNLQIISNNPIIQDGLNINQTNYMKIGKNDYIKFNYIDSCEIKVYFNKELKDTYFNYLTFDKDNLTISKTIKEIPLSYGQGEYRFRLFDKVGRCKDIELNTLDKLNINERHDNDKILLTFSQFERLNPLELDSVDFSIYYKEKNSETTTFENIDANTYNSLINNEFYNASNKIDLSLSDLKKTYPGFNQIEDKEYYIQDDFSANHLTIRTYGFAFSRIDNLYPQILIRIKDKSINDSFSYYKVNYNYNYNDDMSITSEKYTITSKELDKTNKLDEFSVDVEGKNIDTSIKNIEISVDTLDTNHTYSTPQVKALKLNNNNVVAKNTIATLSPNDNFALNISSDEYKESISVERLNQKLTFRFTKNAIYTIKVNSVIESKSKGESFAFYKFNNTDADSVNLATPIYLLGDYIVNPNNEGVSHRLENLYNGVDNIKDTFFYELVLEDKTINLLDESVDLTNEVIKYDGNKNLVANKVGFAKLHIYSNEYTYFNREIRIRVVDFNKDLQEMLSFDELTTTNTNTKNIKRKFDGNNFTAENNNLDKVKLSIGENQTDKRIEVYNEKGIRLYDGDIIALNENKETKITAKIFYTNNDGEKNYEAPKEQTIILPKKNIVKVDTITQTKENLGNVMFWSIALGTGGIIIVGLIVAVFLFTRKKQKKNTKQTII